jgi:hypothetical protein
MFTFPNFAQNVAESWRLNNMHKKYYIEDFVEEFDYSGIIFKISKSVNLKHLRLKLDEDYLYCLHRFDAVLDNRLFYIENGDLQIINSKCEILELVNYNCYTLKNLYEDKNGFFIFVEVLQ